MRAGRIAACALLSIVVVACATPENGTATENTAPEKSATNKPGAPDRHQAETAFAMYINDPTNRDSWKWVCEAAAGGIGPAQYIVAVRYRDGAPPVSRDLPRAYFWFTAADRSGLVVAAIEREIVAKEISDKEARTAEKRLANFRSGGLRWRTGLTTGNH